jgi:hypothetical protein
VRAQQGQVAAAAGIPAAAHQLLEEGMPPVPGSLSVSSPSVEQQLVASKTSHLCNHACIFGGMLPLERLLAPAGLQLPCCALRIIQVEPGAVQTLH